MHKYDEALNQPAPASYRAAQILGDAGLNTGRGSALGVPFGAPSAPAVEGLSAARSGASPAPLPTLLGSVAEIAGLDDHPPLRNLLITQGYHDLSEGLAGLLGGSNANWCTFATWASKAAGRFIRKDALPAELRSLLLPAGVAPERGLSRLGARLFGPQHDQRAGLLALPDRVLDDVASMIAQGNLKVFAELGPVFARMIEIYDGCQHPGDDRLEALLEPIRPGPSTDGGQGLLRSALTLYHRAMLAEDPDARAEAILLANARVGLHEQMRLQPYIAGSLNAPVRSIVRTFNQGTARLPEALQSAALDGLLQPAIQKIEALWREIATKEMMTLKLPDGVLNLGADLPAVPGQPLYPTYLRTIEDPELHTLLAEYGAHDSTSRGSGASDWSYLPARMAYILELFRSRQCDAVMRQPPFSRAQHAEILDRRMPSGGDL